jgi:hypothetical protein
MISNFRIAPLFLPPMKVHHSDSGITCYLINDDGNFFIEIGKHKTTLAKDDLQAAIWFLIDWVRMSSFTNITGRELKAIHELLNSRITLDKETIMNLICGKKINTIFYDKAFSVILEGFLEEKKEVTLTNEQNFFIYQEIVQIIKQNSFAIYS